jgi:nucleoside-diphosphate-sugar epimerase
MINGVIIRSHQPSTDNIPMRIFVTGSTGFIGTPLVKLLLGAGHQVIGLTRSEVGAQALAAAGAEAFRGSLEDPAGLRAAASRADGVIHLAFNHDFSKFAANCEADRRVIEALGDELAGSGRPLVVTSGTAMANAGPGQIADEDSPALSSAQIPRAASEEAARAAAAKGVAVSVVRLPQVHDETKQGLVPYVTRAAKEKGVSVYIGDGAQRWAAGHISDVALLYRLAIERAAANATYNAVGEVGVAMKAIAEVIGRGLGVPVKSIPASEAAAHFGWLAMFAGHDMPASSALTQKLLNWHPQGPGLISDLERMDYSKVTLS